MNKHAVGTGDSEREPPPRTRAEVIIHVQSSEVTPYDETENPILTEIRLSETFTGDIQGNSTVRALQVRHDDGSEHMISMQRVYGRLAGREGTFLLEGSETVQQGRIKATWFVVPRSGTGGLARLRGEGGFEGEFGKGSVGTLDYWFE